MVQTYSIAKVFVICCLALQYGIYTGVISYYYAVALSLILSLSYYLYSRKKSACFVSARFVGYLAIPVLLGVCYSCILFVLYNNSNIDFVKLFSRTLFYSATLLQGISLVLLFGKKAIDVLFEAAVLFYSIRVLEYLFQNGISSLVKYITTTISGTDMSETSILEAHEVTFVFGLFFIYYFSRNFALYKKKLLIALVFMILGYKRIMIPGILVAFIVIFLLKKIRLKKLSVIFVAFLGCFGSFAWLYLIKSNQIYTLAKVLDINFMGRLSLYRLISSEYEITPFFSGRGFGYLDVWSQIHTVETNGTALHNDTVLMYVELGFVLFVAYFIYYFVFLYSKSRSIYKYILPGIFCYTIICWCTDNVQVYFNYQVVELAIVYLLISERKQLLGGYNG